MKSKCRSHLFENKRQVLHWLSRLIVCIHTIILAKGSQPTNQLHLITRANSTNPPISLVWSNPLIQVPSKMQFFGFFYLFLHSLKMLFVGCCCWSTTLPANSSKWKLLNCMQKSAFAMNFYLTPFELLLLLALCLSTFVFFPSPYSQRYGKLCLPISSSRKLLDKC